MTNFQKNNNQFKNNVNNFSRAEEFINGAKMILSSHGLQQLRTYVYNENKNTKYLEEWDADKAIDGGSRDSNISKSNFYGLPVFDTIILGGSDNNNGVGNLSYKDLDGTPHTLPPFEIICVLLDVNKSKTIIETQLVGQRLPVTEYISDGAWQINMKGVLVSKFPDSYPHDELKRLLEFDKVPVPVDITSNLLLDMGVTSITIKAININQQEGMRNVIPFEIQASEDIPYEINYND